MDAKISALEKQYALLQKKRDALDTNMNGIHDKVKRLRHRRDMEARDGLSKEEEMEFRYALTIVGEMLENKNVLFGGLEIVHDEPDSKYDSGYFGDRGPRKYSIDIQSNFVLCVSPGLRIHVKIKTKTPAIRRIVRDMVESTGYEHPEDKMTERTYWGIDWDFYDHIKIIKKVTLEEYYGFKDNGKL